MSTLELPGKREAIVDELSGFDGALVAFSGGVDSSVVSHLAHEALGDDALAVTADSETLPDGELEEARRVADEIGIRHRVVEFSELEEPEFAANPEDRCYHCRKGLIENLKEVAAEEGLERVVDGTNVSDLGGHRPGFEAVKEEGIYSPLVEHDVSKEEVRDLAREAGLSVAEKPSLACLSSRIPYGEEITEEKLEMVAEAEEYLRDLGFLQIRVRLHGGELARVEVHPDERLRAAGRMDQIAERLKDIGFQYVTLDLEGYRTGAMDEAL